MPYYTGKNLAYGWNIKKSIPEDLMSDKQVEESRMIAEYLDMMYTPYAIGWQEKYNGLGWYHNGENIARTSRSLPFYKSISWLEKIVNKIKKSGYKFQFEITPEIKKMFLSEQKEDVMIGRGLRDNIWNEIIQYITIQDVN